MQSTHNISTNTISNEITLDIDIIDHFESIVAQDPDVIAIINHYGTEYSYDELNVRINQIAHYLLNTYPDLFFRKDEDTSQAHIGITGDHLIDVIAVQFACLKLGAAYTVIHTNEASERISFINQDAKLDFIINCDSYQGPYARDLPPACKITSLRMSTIEEQIENENENKDNFSAQIKKQLNIRRNSLAYYIYTSGSTGQPKGVMQKRHGLLGQIKFYTEAIGLNDHDTLLGTSPLTHDQGISNLYSTLLTGSTFIIFKLGVGEDDYQNVIDNIKKYQVTVLVAVPTVWEKIAEKATKQALSSINTVRLGGEETKAKHIALFKEKCSPNACLYSAYGASECSFISLNKETHETDLASLNDGISMGKFLPHIKYKCIPMEGETCDDSGMLAISSPYMANGYTSTEENEKAYHDNYYLTGDIVKIEYGVPYFIGREAWHEKILGNRINLRGIEQILEKDIASNQGIPGCECVVVVIGDGDDKSLIAFISGKNKDKVDINQLKIRLNLMLPPYEVPRKIEVIDHFPLLENKKVDRKKIKQMAEDLFVSIKEKMFSKIHKLSDLLNHLEEIWCDALNISYPLSIECERSTFDGLGGDSICSIVTSNYINKIINKCILKLDADEVNSLITPYDVHKHNLRKFSKIICVKIDEYVADNQSECDQENLNVVPSASVSPKYLNYHSVSLFNIHAMQNLINFSCQQYGIDIKLCTSMKHFIQCIKQVVTEGKKKQCGFIVFGANKYGAQYHVYPCILSFDIKSDKWCLFISDSTARSHGYASSIQSSLKKIDLNDQVNIYLDSIKRVDGHACNVDALYYLENGLRLSSFVENVYIINNKRLEDNHVSYLSPPVCMQVYQCRYTEYRSAVAEMLKKSVSIEEDELNNILNSEFISNTNKLIENNCKSVKPIKECYTKIEISKVSLRYNLYDKNIEKDEIVLEKTQEGFHASWYSGDILKNVFLKFEIIPHEVLKSIPQIGSTLTRRELCQQLIMLQEENIFTKYSDSNFHVRYHTYDTYENIYYYHNSEKLFRVAIYGAQLCNLDRQLNDYAKTLNENLASSNTPNIFRKPISPEESILIKNTINTISYLKVLFKLIETNKDTHFDMNVFEEILFGGQRAPDRRLNEIIRHFIQSLNDKYLIKGDLIYIEKDINLWYFIRYLHDDCNMKFTINYAKFNYYAQEHAMVISLDHDYVDNDSNPINNDQIMKKEENNKRKYDESVNDTDTSEANKRQRLT